MNRSKLVVPGFRAAGAVASARPRHGRAAGLQHRVVAGACVRAVESDVKGLFTAIVMRYQRIDTYNTMFMPGVFTKSLQTRLPRVAWGHDWTEPIGRVVRYEDTDKLLKVVGQLDDFDAVPMAKRAWAQMKSGTIDQFSVGFIEDQYRKSAKYEGVIELFGDAELAEVSPVLLGSVPGTALVELRTRMGTQRRAEMPALPVILNWFARIAQDPEQLTAVTKEMIEYGMSSDAAEELTEALEDAADEAATDTSEAGAGNDADEVDPEGAPAETAVDGDAAPSGVSVDGDVLDPGDDAELDAAIDDALAALDSMADV